MKNKISILILLAVIMVPQVASAAWWNPFSWKIFHRTDTKTQILENRVKELEKKLENVATSTADSIQTKKSGAIKTETEEPNKITINPQKQTTPTPATTNYNFSQGLVDLFNKRAELYDNFYKLNQSIIEYIDKNISSLTSTRNKMKAYRDGLLSSGSVDTSILDTFVEAYDADIEATNSYKNVFLLYNRYAQSMSNIHKDSARQSMGIFVSKQDFTVALQDFQNDTKLTDLEKKFDSMFEEYKTYRENTDNEYNRANAYILGVYNGAKSSIIQYTPQPLPRIPTMQNTYCSMAGNTISCNSYSY